MKNEVSYIESLVIYKILLITVSQLWRLVVKRKWKKITEITYDNVDPYGYPGKKPQTIDVSAKDAKKMILRSVNFCNALKVCAKNTDTCVIKFGPFQYRLKNANIDNVLQFFAEIATELTEVTFFESPKKELLQLLFKKNKIKSIGMSRVRENDVFWLDIPTDAIEKLHVHLINPSWDLKSFEGVRILVFETNFHCFVITILNVISTC